VLAAASSLLILAGLLPAAVAPALAVVSPNLVISEVYGGGGNAGATHTHDYIELYNRGAAPATLNGLSLQYASATGTGNFGANTGQLTELPDATLAPGQYFLVQEAGGTTGVALPPPNHVDPTPINLSGTAGKVALVSGTTSLGCNGSTGQPCAPAALSRIIDLVGYGNANLFEGPGAAPGLSSTTAAIRAAGGATDTDNNAADFAAGAPDPDSSADSAPMVVSTTPSADASSVDPSTNVSITFSEPVTATGDWFSIQCSTSGAHPAAASGGPTTFVLDPATNFGSSESCTVTVVAAQIADADTNDPPDNMAADYSWSFSMQDVCTLPFTTIPAIQGSASSAAITGPVSTQGVVIGDYEGPQPELRGFYIQDPAGDGNPATSDGIFVFNGGDDEVALGDLVRVSGTAAEFQDQTQVTASTVTDCGDGTVTPTDVSLPFATLDQREQYEGMLVRLPQTLIVNETFQLGRFGQVTVGSERHFSPTLVAEPGPAALAEIERQRLDSLIIDDELQNQNRDPILFGRSGNPLTAENTLRIGDSVTGVVGVMTYTWAGNSASGNAYRVRPIDALGGGVPAFQSANPRPANPEPIDGDLRVAAMNVLNYFSTIDAGPDVCGPTGGLDCRGADSQLEFERQEAKIVAAITGLDADIVGLNEIENNASASLASLVGALDAVDGPGTWAYIDTGTIGTDAIKVALIYKPAAVTPVGASALLTSAIDPRFDDTRSRPALAQTFDQLGGGRLTVVVNHLKSKGSGCGAGDDATDGSGNCDGTRTMAAEALVDWLATDPTNSGDRDVLVIGDLNSYAREAPIDVFIRAGYTNLIEQFVGDEAYSYVFDASSGYLDHALASPTLAAQVKGATEWHINADEPGILDYNTEFKSAAQVEYLYAPDQYRSADHDPLIVGLDLLDYGFKGFEPPVENPPAVNVVRAGQSVPIKWRMSVNLGPDVLFGEPTSTEYTCGAIGGAPPVPGSGSDASRRPYTYVWTTDKAWAGQCREFEITFDDGTYRTANFRFR